MFFSKETEKKVEIRYTLSMDYEIRRLALFKDLLYLPGNLPKDFTGEKMTRFRTEVDQRNLEPKSEQYLMDGKFCGYGIPSNTDGSIEVVLPEGLDGSALEKIPAGTYAFVQGDYSTDENPVKAAEALWLECLWEEWEPVDNLVFLREIPHGNTTVFQLFRQIKD